MIFILIFVSVYGCFACMYIYALCVFLVATETRTKPKIPFPQIGITGGSKLSCGCWGLNSGKETRALNHQVFT